MMRLFLKSKSQKAWMFLGLLAVLGMSSEAAFAQSRDVTNRLSRIENEIETLNRAVYRGETPPPSAGGGQSAASNAATEVRLQQLELELRDIRGKIEEQSYNIRQMQEKLDRSLSDMELRMNDVEGGRGAGVNNGGAPYIAGGASAAKPAAPNNAGGAQDNFTWNSNSNAVQSGVSGKLGTLSSGTSMDGAAASYENAFALLKGAKYEAAGRGFTDFLNKNPKHELAGNAKYWLGETYYVRGQYDQAARIFAEGYQTAPKGAKAADNLLKLGMSLSAIGNNTDACVALLQLKQDFSTGSDAVLRRASQEMTRLNCP